MGNYWLVRGRKETWTLPSDDFQHPNYCPGDAEDGLRVKVTFFTRAWPSLRGCRRRFRQGEHGVRRYVIVNDSLSPLPVVLNNVLRLSGWV
jgi:hypothetical protein